VQRAGAGWGKLSPVSATRRRFSAQLLGSLAMYGLIDALASRDLWAAPIKLTIDQWLRDLATMTRDLRGRRLTDVEFQGHVEELLRRVDLPELVRSINVDEVERRLVPGGATVQDAGLRAPGALPAGAAFNKRLFVCSRGRAIVPHGHTNMCSAFLIIKGAWRGRHFERVETHADHCVIAPTIDRTFAAGDASTISDHRDNVHWFTAESGVAHIFNVHVAGYDPTIAGSPGRLYLDADGEVSADGKIIKARRMTAAQCRAKYE
jgi:hypothetical protein